MLGRSDDPAMNSLHGFVFGLSDTSLSGKWRECSDAQFDEFFDEPLLTIAFRERDTDLQSKWEFAVD